MSRDYTPGPWRWISSTQPHEYSGLVSGGCTHKPKHPDPQDCWEDEVLSYYSVDSNTVCVQDANAALISAAPELAEAGRAMLICIDTHQACDLPCGTDRMRVALKKAGAL